MRAIITTILLVVFAATSAVAEPIRIGLSLGLTGKYKEVSDMQLKAFRMWEFQINRRGGILGRNVSLLVYDDKSDAKTARALYEKMIKTDKVDLLLSPYSSELRDAVIPVTEKHGYPMIISGTSSENLWKKNNISVFGIVSPSTRFSIDFLYMLSRYDFKNIAIVYEDDTFALNLAKGTKEWAENFGMKVLLYNSIGKGDDLGKIAARLKETNPQALIVCGHFTEAVDMRQAILKQGWYPKAYYASVGPALSDYYTKLGAKAERTFSSSRWEPIHIFPGSKEFHDTFLKTYGKAPSYHAAEAYAAGEVLGKAIRKAQTLNREKVTAVLSSLNTTSIIGRFGADKSGSKSRYIPMIIQWQKGKKEIVWPENISTARPKFK